MLEHALQTAAIARQADADDSLVLAALLHDVGHLIGEAGTWGLPSHAEVGARWLANRFDEGVSEPIRLHVDAKRHLVATDAAYASALSHASTMSLAEQGGPLSEEEQQAFLNQPFAQEALTLRRWDDDGKVEGLVIAQLHTYRALVERFVRQPSPTWIRDACRCAACRDEHSGQHLIDATELAGWSVEAATERGFVLRRADGTTHECILAPSELPIRPQLETWGSSHRDGLQKGARNDAAFVHDLVTHGVAMMRDVPGVDGEVLRFAERFGYVRETNYGRLFDVRVEPTPENLAYSSLGLPLHTDNPYRDPTPTVQLLHCLRPADEGGATQVADGFRAAHLLRSEFPDDFAVLTSTWCTFRFRSDSVDLQARRPLISVGADGEVIAVAVNHRSMETPTGHNVEAFYRSYTTFCDLLASPDAVVEFVLEAGDLIAVDNRRVLHARTAFRSTERHLQGCYIDSDAVRSTHAVAAR